MNNAFEDLMSIPQRRIHQRATVGSENAAAGQAREGGTLSASPSVGELLGQVREGLPSALNSLTALLYTELRRLARRQLLGQGAGHTLRTSDLVNEAYLKLANVGARDWKDSAHFLAVASSAMRSVLVDYARWRSYAKHGGNAKRISLSSADLLPERLGNEVVAVDEALAHLSQLAPRASQVVELRYFAGFSIEETAEAMRVSTGTVKREWNMARAWLRQELAQRNPA
jgi:RNA polymerase sigma factor (TIGR02999 family)